MQQSMLLALIAVVSVLNLGLQPELHSHSVSPCRGLHRTSQYSLDSVLTRGCDTERVCECSTTKRLCFRAEQFGVNSKRGAVGYELKNENKATSPLPPHSSSQRVIAECTFSSRTRTRTLTITERGVGSDPNGPTVSLQ